MALQGILFAALCFAAAPAHRHPQPAPPSKNAAPVHVYDLAKQGLQYDEVVRFLRSIETAEPCEPCDEFYGGRDRIQKYLQDVLRFNLVAVGRASDIRYPGVIYSAFVNSGGTDTPAGYMALFINLDGVFFNTKLEIGGDYRGGSRAARLLLLYHELGHALLVGSVLPDYGDAAASDANTSMVLVNCRRAIELEAATLKRGVGPDHTILKAR